MHQEQVAAHRADQVRGTFEQRAAEAELHKDEDAGEENTCDRRGQPRLFRNQLPPSQPKR